MTKGPEYYLGLNNFYVITRYNRSRLYALAVHQTEPVPSLSRQNQNKTDTAGGVSELDEGVGFRCGSGLRPRTSGSKSPPTRKSGVLRHPLEAVFDREPLLARPGRHRRGRVHDNLGAAGPGAKKSPGGIWPSCRTRCRATNRKAGTVTTARMWYSASSTG